MEFECPTVPTKVSVWRPGSDVFSQGMQDGQLQAMLLS